MDDFITRPLGLTKLTILLSLSFLLSFTTFSSCSNQICLSNSDMTEPAVCEAVDVIERTFGFLPSNVYFSVSEKDGDTDSYRLHSDGRVLHVSGSSAVAICKGFYDYILENGYGVASWTGNRLDFPKRPAPCSDVKVISPFAHHLFNNVCTFGYTSPFWNWERWEQEIDWLALHGFDMPLAPIAGEAILARTWRNMGIPEEGIREYFCGPAHLPWLRMGNMTAMDGGMSAEWYEDQLALEHKIVDRMNDLGMTPVFQGFAGFVPKAIKEKYPDVDLTVTKWQGLESYMLSPLDGLFSEIGTAFIQEWEKEFGKGKYYLIDSFNELEIPFGPKGSKERYDRLHHYSETIYKSLATANPDAIWVMQGWMFGYSRNIWDPESVEALLTGVPDDKMMIIDLAVDFNDYVWRSENSWDYLSGFYGKEWIWSTVPNFGGRSALKGPLDFYLNAHLDALESDNSGSLAGFGSSPEGIENNEVVYELISHAGWSGSRTDLNGFLKNYSKARYGGVSREIMNFWKGMRESVYDNFTNNARFLWQQRPAYHRGETMEINSSYYEAIEEFLSAPDRFRRSDLYVVDAVQYAAFYIAGKADEVLKAANWAIVAGDIDKAVRLEELLYAMLADADRLLESHPVLRMERWLDFAKEAGTSTEEKAAFVKEGKRLVTTWGGPSLKDYSCRVWSGLIRDFYIPRLQHFFNSANQSEYVDMRQFESQYHYGADWNSPDDVELEGEGYVSRIEKFENPLEAAVQLVKKYGKIRYEDGERSIAGADGKIIERWNEYAPEHEIGFWMPQDFTERKTRRLYFSFMSEDYAGMKGIRISDVRGNPICIRKMEFISGHDKLMTLTPEVKVGGEMGSSADIDVLGPESAEGLEREVKMFLTIDGGPDSYGMVSFL